MGVKPIRLNGQFTVILLTRTALMLAMTLAVQGLRLPPPLTGPLVNLMLILSTSLTGAAAGAGIGLFTPWVALFMGIIPPVLAPAVPFIMAGNALYCLSFAALGGKTKGGPFAGVALGAVLKFTVIAGAARLLLPLPAPVAEVLLFPQLINALIGGLLALPVAHYLGRILPKPLQ